MENTDYQFLIVYMRDEVTQQTPIFLCTYVEGYMVSPAARPQTDDVLGHAPKSILNLKPAIERWHLRTVNHRFTRWKLGFFDP